MYQLPVRKITITIPLKYQEYIIDLLGILNRDYQVFGENIVTTSKQPREIDEEVETLSKLIRQYKNEFEKNYSLGEDFKAYVTY
jgi:hypothetical protein